MRPSRPPPASFRYSENLVRIIHTLSNREAWTIAEIVHETGITKSTVDKNLRRLVAIGLVAKLEFSPCNWYEFSPTNLNGKKAERARRLDFAENVVRAAEKFGTKEEFARIFDLFDDHGLVT